MRFPKSAMRRGPRSGSDCSTATSFTSAPNRSSRAKAALPEEAPRRLFSASTVSDRDFAEPLTNVVGTLAEKLAIVVKAAARQRLVKIVLE